MTEQEKQDLYLTGKNEVDIEDEAWKETLKRDIKYLEEQQSRIFELYGYWTGTRSKNEGVEVYETNAINKLIEAKGWLEEALVTLRANLDGVCGH